MMKAKQYLFIAIEILLFLDLAGQSFEIPIYFEDSVGNKDSIVLGYNELASYGIDPNFGEIDLIDSVYADDFEVRAAIYGYSAELGVLPRIIESKKMIIGYICFDSTYFNEANSFMIVIKSQNWPISITWDKSSFKEQCNHMDIIDCTAGGWFDICIGGHPYLLLEMNHKDTATYYDTEFKTEANGDTLGALFFSFFSDFGSNVSLVQNNNIISVNPNPTSGQFHISYPLTEDDKIIITDLSGKSIPYKQSLQEIDLLSAAEGIYLLTLRLDKGGTFIAKVLKNRS